jgi:ADP-heptose:LPS heptosyltransferase
MHLAGALDVPVVALYGTGHLPLWSPFSATSRTVLSPLFGDGQVHQVDENLALARKNMAAIEPQVVMSAFEAVYNHGHVPQ